jgi:phage terminase small subunit
MSHPATITDLAPPPPANNSWHRFANHVIAGGFLVDAYLAAGYKCSRTTGYVKASNLRRKPAVAAYIDYWQNLQYQQRVAESRSRMGR